MKPAKFLVAAKPSGCCSGHAKDAMPMITANETPAKIAKMVSNESSGRTDMASESDVVRESE